MTAPPRYGRTALTLVLAAVLLAAGRPASAAASAQESARASLEAVFAERADLRQAFRSDWTAVASSRTAGMRTLEDWARLYGSKEYPDRLALFAAGAVPARAASAPPRALSLRPSAYVPVMKPDASFDFKSLSAEAVLVVDAATRDVLLSKNAHEQWPLASITKLMTAMVALDRRVPMSRKATMTKDDEVGGARLRVAPGSTLSVRAIFDTMLVGSANNSANALSRATKLARKDFVAEMNAKAKALGLRSTVFVDPTGIEPANVSSAEDVAALAFEALELPEVRRATTSPSVTVVTTARQVHTVKSTDGLLTDERNGLYVLGGKTGYLDESKWNFVVKMRDARDKPVVVVVLGSDSQTRSFGDAAAAAKWVWDNYRWVPARK
ncbi:MAG: hypothetical protein RL272_288 [Candidatus Parcubacteria bacterium]|jgi:D-alanyl-D-alanine endopeptidase (penicillin-binding protein 7)